MRGSNNYARVELIVSCTECDGIRGAVLSNWDFKLALTKKKELTVLTLKTMNLIFILSQILKFDFVA